ncbi:MAG: hypothetical protein ACM3SY_15195 [Candidatus Omnitrophota bacterium]
MKLNRTLVLRALTDPKFRKMLEENPLEAAELAQITGGIAEVNSILSAVQSIGTQIYTVGDELLCSTDPCKISIVAYA